MANCKLTIILSAFGKLPRVRQIYVLRDECSRFIYLSFFRELKGKNRLTDFHDTGKMSVAARRSFMRIVL